MSQLSPAAQAVWNAAYNTPEDCPYEHDLAAALRAAVAHTQQHHNHDMWKCDADELLAIAEELEAQ